MNHIRLRPVGVMSAPSLALLALLVVSTTCLAVEVDLTRHLASVVRTDGQPNGCTEHIFGTEEGQARLIATNGDGNDPATRVTAATVYLNGETVLSPGRFERHVETIEVPVSLVADNQITVDVRGKPGSQLTVRVKQLEDVNLNIIGRIHFQVNASDLEVSKAFCDPDDTFIELLGAMTPP